MAMLGAQCSVCCGSGRCGCTDGKLPYTMTVTFSGLQNKTHGNYCDLYFSPCYGVGAVVGVASAPGGCDGDEDAACGTIKVVEGKCDDEITYGKSNRGPLTGVILTDGGSGYAKIGRVAPTLAVSAPIGTGATLTPTLGKFTESDGVDFYFLKSISTSGGDGYENGTNVLIAASPGDTVYFNAAAVILSPRGKPTLKAVAGGGQGAELTPTVSVVGWGVSLAVSNGGTGYTYGSPVNITLGADGVAAKPLQAVAKTTLQQPTVSLTAAGGAGATLTASLQQKTYPDGKPYWTVSSASIGAAGEGYKAGSVVSASATDGKVDLGSAFVASVSSVSAKGGITGVSICYGGKFHKDSGVIESVFVTEPGDYYRANSEGPPTQPTLAASVGGGSGGSIAVSLQDASWGVTSVAVDKGGSGYTYGGGVTIETDGPVTAASKTVATLVTALAPPVISLSVVQCEQVGFGAVLTPTLAQHADENGRPYWAVSSVAVTNAGQNYKAGDRVIATVTSGQQMSVAGSAFSATVASVESKSGGVTAVSIASGGKFFLDTGVVQSVSVSDSGRYYRRGVPSSVHVSINGEYWREDENATPYVSPIKVAPCGGGEGALISATVDTNLKSATYGQITELTIGDGGTDYLAWEWIDTCRNEMNGIPFVLRATDPINLVTLSLSACYGSGAAASVVPLGPRAAPGVCVTGSGTGGKIDAALSGQKDADGLDYWTISGVSASGGYGYTNNEAASVTFKPSPTINKAPSVTLQATGVTEEDPPDPENDGVLTGATVVDGGKFFIQREYDGTAGPIKKVQIDSPGSGYALLGREQPSITLEAQEGSLGSGATFTPTFEQKQDDCGVDYWQIKSVAASGGTCYGAANRTSPALSLSLPGGSGANFTLSLDKAKGSCGESYWYAKSISVNGGTGYQDGLALTVSLQGKTVEEVALVATVATKTVNCETGVPYSVSIQNSGKYYTPPAADETLKITLATKNDKQDQAASITIQANKAGAVTGATVLNAGKYYRENKSLTPYVADVTVTVNQTLPSAGSGAQVTATVESDTSSDKFGQIKSLSLSNGGSNYQILGGPLDCDYYGPCGIGLQFRGTGKAAELTIGDAVFRTNQVLGDCTKLPTSASKLHSIGEGSATIAAGGVWDSEVVCPCQPSGCTPVQKDDPCESDTCPPCTGDCDSCNSCGPGCGCQGGSCTPCEGSCDEENPCPEGCECVDGECVPVPVCCDCPGGHMIFWSPAYYGGGADSIYNPETSREEYNQRIFVSAKYFSGDTVVFLTPSYVSCDGQSGLFRIPLGDGFEAYYRNASGSCSGPLTLTPALPPDGACDDPIACRGNVVALGAAPEDLTDSDWIDLSGVTIQLECIGCCCEDGAAQAGKSYLECVQDGGQWAPSATIPANGPLFLGRCFESGYSFPQGPPPSEDSRCSNPLP